MLDVLCFVLRVREWIFLIFPAPPHPAPPQKSSHLAHACAIELIRPFDSDNLTMRTLAFIDIRMDVLINKYLKSQLTQTQAQLQIHKWVESSTLKQIARGNCTSFHSCTYSVVLLCT